MSQSRGAVSFEPLFRAEDIGLRKGASVEHVMKVFVTLGEGRASRWIEMPKGVLLLQTVPDDPASGAIYLYDRELQVFYFVVFDLGRDDSLTAAEFDELVTEYDLVSWTAHPALLRRAVAKRADGVTAGLPRRLYEGSRPSERGDGTEIFCIVCKPSGLHPAVPQTGRKRKALLLSTEAGSSAFASDHPRALERSANRWLYALNPKTQRSKWVAIDADYENALVDLLKLQWELHQDGVEAALEKSRRGAHLWIFAHKPLLARHCRIYIYNLALRLKVPVKGGSDLAEGIEVFPRQDELGPDQFGNAIRGPLGIHRATRRRYWFYGQTTESRRNSSTWSTCERSRRPRWTGSFMDLRCRKSFVRSRELSCRHPIPRAHSSAFLITSGRRRSAAGTTGHVALRVQRKDVIAAATIWPFQCRIRANTSAGRDVRRK